MIGALTSALPVILQTITKFMPVLNSQIGNIAKALARLDFGKVIKIAELVGDLSDILNLTGSKIPMNELGYKAMNSEKNRSDFDSTAKYIKYLESEVEIDTEKLSDLSKEDKFVAFSVGSAIIIAGISDVCDVQIGVGFLKTVVEKGLEAKEIKVIIDDFKKNNLNLDDFSKYLDGKLPVNEAQGVADILRNAFGQMYGGMSKSEINKKIADLKN